MGFISSLPVPKRILGLPFSFQNLSYLDIINQQAKFEWKSIAHSLWGII